LRWFPSTPIKNAWVGFDIMLGFALFALSLRWRPWLATVLVGLVVADACLTVGQAVVFNLRRAKSPWDLLFIGIACLAPTVAAVVLSRARALRLHWLRGARPLPQPALRA